MRGSLRLRLLAGAFFFIALGLVITWVTLQGLFAGYVAAQYEREMSTVVDTLAAGLEFDGVAPRVAAAPADPRFALPAGGRYWAVEPEGGEALRSRSLWDTPLGAANLAPSFYRAFSVGEGPDGEPVLVFGRDLTFDTPAGERAVVIRAGFPAAEMEASLAAFRRELATMLGLTACILLIAAVLQVLVGLRPLALLQAEVARVRAGTAARLDAGVPVELRPLVSEINDLLDDKAAALERARTRAADLAHGLKTPLTAIVQVAETLPPEKGGQIVEHVAMIRRRADRQLQRARMGVEQESGGEIARIAARLVKVISAIPSDRAIAWRLDVPAGLAVPVDTADLAEALGNILDNARKWAASRVDLSARLDRGEIVIAVADDGPGIAPEDCERIMERGVHADDPEGETGLGLAIAREIAEAYGGTLSLGRAPAGGLLVTLALPRAARRSRPA
ncbi:MAG: HAMP domain-containing sensor histidine kinase [Oricola sp.]